MARVFISHAGRDTESAAEVQRWLVEDGHEVFLDRDPQDGIGLGDEWEQRLHERLRWSDAVVCVVTAAYLRSPWCAAEVGAARSRGSRMLPVVAEPGVVHPLLRPVQHTDMAHDPAAARQALTAALRRLDAVGGAGWPDGESPFPGLVAFGSALRHVFFGRSDEIGRFLELLRSPVERAEGGIHLVVGPSGCGKSSLVRAGLAPAVAEEPEWWTGPPFVPGTDPVGALARNLAIAARQVGLDWTIAHVRARLDESGLADPAAELLLAAPGGKARRLLVVVDQLEELLTQTAPSDRARFAELVHGALTGPVLVVATLRSEFLDRFLAQSELADLRPRLHPVQPLRRHTLRAVIEGPARIAGIRVEDELVDRLVADTDSGAALPLLAFTLAELARGVGRGDELSAARYDQLGGVRGALTRQADAALADAVQAEGRSRDDVLAGLLRLVTVDEQGNPTSWRVDRSELPAAVATELDAFVARRLLITDTSDDGSAVIGVAHEAFLTAWPPLRDAINAEASALRARRAVEHGAAEWDRSGRPTERLWERGQLAAAVADTGARVESASAPPDPSDAAPARRGLRAPRLLRRRNVVTDRIPVSATARAFLLASIRRDRLRRGRATTVLSVLCALALVAAGIAFVQQRFAQEQQRVATARQLVAQADLIRGNDPQTALMLNIAAERIQSDADSHAALVNSLMSSRYAGTLTGHTAETNSPTFTADGRVMATGGIDGKVILWDITGERPRRLGAPLTSNVGLVGSRVFSPDGRVLATARLDGTVMLWDVTGPSGPRPIGQPIPVRGSADRLSYSPDGRTLAVGSSYPVVETVEAAVELWDISTAAEARRLGEPAVLGNYLQLLEFHPAGTALVIATANSAAGRTDYGVVVWDIADPAKPRPIGPPLAYAGNVGNSGHVAFHPRTRLLAVGTDPLSSIVAFWDLTDPASPRQLPGGDRRLLDVFGLPAEPVELLRFSPDGATLAVATTTASGGGAVQFWDLTGPYPTLRFQLRRPEVADRISEVAFDLDRGTVATASGSVNVVTQWDLGEPVVARQIGQTIVGENGSLAPAAFLPNGRSLLTTRADGTMILWDLTDPGTARRHDTQISEPGAGRVSSLAFFPGPETLTIGHEGGSVEQYQVTGSAVSGPGRQLQRGVGSLGDTVLAPRTGLVATGGPDGSTPIVVTDTRDSSRTGQISNPFPDDPRDTDAEALGFSPDGQVLAMNVPQRAAARPASRVVLWDVGDAAHPRYLGAPLEPLGFESRAAFSLDGRLLAGRVDAADVGLVDISDPARPGPIGDPLAGHSAMILAMAFSPDSTVLATAGEDHNIIMWDVAEPGRPARHGPPLTGHTDSVQTLAFSSDGRTLASGDLNGDVILWDLADPAHPRRLGSTLSGHGSGPSELLFSPDDNVLFVGDGAGAVTTWDLTEFNALRSDPRQAACDRTGRGLDPSEWERYVSGLDYQDTCGG
jgi:WD40 repeat protein